MEETTEGQRDTHGRINSRLALRRHEATLQRELLHREREFTGLTQRQSHCYRENEREKERTMTTVAHLETQTHIRDVKQMKANDWFRVMTAEQMKMDANVSLTRTWCVPKRLDWTPPLKETVTKERLVMSPDGTTPEMNEDGVTPTGRKETYEEEIDIDEKRSLEIQCNVISQKIASFTTPVMIENPDETVNELMQASDENGVLKTERIHPEPIAIVFNKWKTHPYDSKGTAPKWSFQIEMPDPTAMNNISHLFQTETSNEKKKTNDITTTTNTTIDEDTNTSNTSNNTSSATSSTTSSTTKHLVAQTLVVRYNNRQDMRRIKLEILRDAVRRENARVCVLNESVIQSHEISNIRNNHTKDVKEEILMFHRRCGAVNRMESVHRKLLGWIAHRASRSMQTKDELLLLAKNAQHKVRKAQSDLNEAKNPLTAAFCEQRLHERLREADKVLRYVRKRFHAELDVRRKLAEERRSELLQQCARLELVSKMSLERSRNLRKVRRCQENEMKSIREKSKALIHQIEIYEGNGASVKETCERVLEDLICLVEEKEKMTNETNTPSQIEAETALININLAKGRALVRRAEEMRKKLVTEQETTTLRSTTREREHATILDEIEKLEGAAGEWLSDNQVQQAEDQLALARSALDDQKNMMEVMKAELRQDYEELNEKLEVQEIQSKAAQKMLKNEINTRRRASGLAIAHMQKVAEQARDALEHLRKEKDAEIMRMAEAHAKQMVSQIKAKQKRRRASIANGSTVVSIFNSSSLLQICFIVIALYLFYLKHPNKTFLTLYIYLTLFTTHYYTII